MESYNNKNPNCVLENMGSTEVGWPEISDSLGLRDTPYIYI